jgi:hypothetical protein
MTPKIIVLVLWLVKNSTGTLQSEFTARLVTQRWEFTHCGRKKREI